MGKSPFVSLVLRQVERIETYLTSPAFNLMRYTMLINHLVDLCEPIADDQFKEDLRPNQGRNGRDGRR